MTDWSVIVNADHRRNPHIAVNAVERACVGGNESQVPVPKPWIGRLAIIMTRIKGGEDRGPAGYQREGRG
jgi:hypothetical protein